MALELFKPFIMKKLVQNGHSHNIKSAKRMVEKVKPEVWDVLDEVIKNTPYCLTALQLFTDWEFKHLNLF